VTGNSLRNKTNVITNVEALLKSRNLYGGTFSSMGEHSPIANIRAALEQVKETGSDILISVGGGSPIDASKAMIYWQQQETGGEFMKQIAIPTTLSAAEYTINAGFTNEKGHKAGVQGTQLTPAGIILDAELTLHTPERLWLSTGIRALDHAIGMIILLSLDIYCIADHIQIREFISRRISGSPSRSLLPSNQRLVQIPSDVPQKSR